MSSNSLFTTKRFLIVMLVFALAVLVACGGSETDEQESAADSGTGATPTAPPARAATPTPTAVPEATPTPIPTAVVTYAGVGVQGGDARILTTGYPELWDPHLLGTIVGLEGTSPAVQPGRRVQSRQSRYCYPRPGGELGEESRRHDLHLQDPPGSNVAGRSRRKRLRTWPSASTG